MKRRVLFFMNSLYGGGAERVLQTLLNHLPANDYDITLYALNQQPLNKLYPRSLTYRYVFRQGGANRLQHLWYRIGNKIKLLIYHHMSPKVFYRLFVRGTYDVEVAFIEGYATRIISGSTNPNSRKLAWVHIDLQQNHWTLAHDCYHSKHEEDKSYRLYDKILCVSKTVKQSLQELYPALTNVEVCYNPINSRHITDAARRGADCTNFIKCKNGLTFVSIGRLVHQKGYDRLIPIMARICSLGHRFTLNILGEGADRQLLEELIRQHGLENEIHLLGFQDNPYPYLAQSDVFLCSSRSEGYSTVVTEAYILGVPTVTTRCSGMDELINDGVDGLISKNDAEALFEAIKRLWDDNMFQILKEGALRRVNDFSIEKTMHEVINLING
jgi:glycosyltransferase involved in cell wall biosynthesis